MTLFKATLRNHSEIKVGALSVISGLKRAGLLLSSNSNVIHLLLSIAARNPR